jgi:hypothetical protein
MVKKSSSHRVWANAVKDLAVIALVAFALWYTHNLWVFLGLFFLFGYKSDKIKTQCPKCNHKFVAVEKADDEEDDN